MRNSTITFAVAISTMMATTAAAQVNEPRAYSVERFRLSIDREGMMDVEWGAVAKHLQWDLGLWLGIEDDPLVLNRRDANGEDRVGRIVDSRFGGALVGALGLFDWVQLGLALPIIFVQQRDDAVPGIAGSLASISGVGLGDLRVVPKLRILEQEDQLLNLAVIAAFTLPTAGGDDYRGEDSVTFAPEVAATRGFESGVRIGANLGYRFRPVTNFADLRVGDELFGRVGAGYRFGATGGPPVEIDASLAVATSAKKAFDDSNRNYTEALLGGTYDFDGPMLAFAGAGLGLADGFGSPDWRVFVGARFSDRSEDRDGDGVADDEDQCPDIPEDRDNFRDDDGCEDVDNDEDGVPDQADGAPMDPEDKDTFEDEDGVPDPDNDQDGVLDRNDDCPLIAGETANRGCPRTDSDKDGILDGADQCRTEPEDVDGYVDEDGCPDPDNDSDGVLDVDDVCPLEAGIPERQGCSDPDRDGDGVVDRLDNCPDVVGPADNQGCEKRQLVRINKDKIEILDLVYFNTSSAVIQSRSYELLDNVAAVINAHPEITKIRVEGHTDSVGSESSNQRLSQRRANAVMAYLIKKQVEAGRLEAMGYGEAKPVASNATKEDRAKNRRVEFTIIGGSATVKEVH